MKNSTKPVANPNVLLREEFDDWAVLFNPDADLGHNGFGLNPTGVCIWKLLDGEHSIDEMLSAVRRDATDVPEEGGDEILAFVEELSQHGLVAYDTEQFHDGRECRLPQTTDIPENLPGGGHEARHLGSGMLRYERPRLEPFTLERRAQGFCTAGLGCTSGSNNHTSCCDGNSAVGGSGSIYGCHTNGTSATGGTTIACGIGISAHNGNSSCGDGLGAYGASGGWNCNFGNSGGACGGGSMAY